jgi:hypothetical protein
MKSFFVDFYKAHSGSSMLTSYVEAHNAEEACRAISIAVPGSRDWKAYEIDEIPIDCPYFGSGGEFMTAKAHQ